VPIRNRRHSRLRSSSPSFAPSGPDHALKTLAVGAIRLAGRFTTREENILRIFAGWDEREAIGFHVFVQSLITRTKRALAITPLYGDQVNGTNRFTNVRFMVPELCSWSGMAIFVDACDMQMHGDISELAGLFNPRYAVQVVKHEYETKSPRKYIGTELEADNLSYPRKNWSSVVIWNCGHLAHFQARDQIRAAVERGDGAYLHRFSWIPDDLIGELPKEFNWLADEYGPNPEAKLWHWTAGIPGFTHYSEAPHADEWKKTMLDVNQGMQYEITVRR
jgi:hypothetical protein